MAFFARLDGTLPGRFTDAGRLFRELIGRRVIKALLAKFLYDVLEVYSETAIFMVDVAAYA